MPLPSPALALLGLACSPAPTPAPAGPDPVERSFDRLARELDANRDGQLQAAELPLGPVPGWDTDGDQRVTARDLEQILLSQPPRQQRDLRSAPGSGSRGNLSQPRPPEEVAALGTLLRSGPPAVARPGPPDIILISLDTVRADRLGLYGAARDPAPALSALAARGTTFERLIANGNESIYSHAAMLIGRYPSEIAAPDYHNYGIPEDALLLSEILGLYGYQSGAFVAGGHLDPAFGFDQGWQRYDAQQGFASLWSTVPSALSWLDQRDPARPTFLFVHGYDAHDPYNTAEPLRHRYGPPDAAPRMEELLRSSLSINQVRGRQPMASTPSFFPHPTGLWVLSIEGPEGQPEGSPLTDVELAHLYDHYDGCLRYGDLWLELLLGALERRGLLDHALVIVTADHGEDLLEHGRVNHRSSLHDSVVHVPLVIAGPGFAAGTRRGELVEQRDLVPTLLQAAGAELPAGLQGRPLQVPQQRELVYAEGVQGALLVRGPRQALIAHGLDLSAPELPDSLARAPLQAPAFSYYDLAADPGQQRDLLLNPAPGDQAAAEALRQALVAWRRQLQTGTHRLPQAEVDPEVARQMQEQGYWSPTPSPP